VTSSRARLALGLLAVAAVVLVALRGADEGRREDRIERGRPDVARPEAREVSPAAARPAEAPHLEGTGARAPTPPPAPAPSPDAHPRLAVEFVDAETGGPVTVRLDREGLPQEIGARWEDLPYVLWEDERCVLSARVLAPDGHVLWDELVWEETRLSPYASSLRAVHPLRLQAQVTAPFADVAGEPPRELDAVNVEVARRHTVLPLPRRDVAGRSRLAGIPFFRDTRFELTAWASLPDGAHERFRGTAVATLPAHAADSVHVPVVLDQPVPAVEQLIGVGGGAGGAFRGRGKIARDDGTGRLRVDVVRSDGRPARGATVGVVGRDLDEEGQRRTRNHATGKADEAGRLAHDRLPAGEYSAELMEPGLVPTTVTFAVHEGRATEATLRESAGGTVHAVVVDEQGETLPFAQARLHQTGRVPWTDLGPGGVQRIDRWTDRLGRRRFDRVAAGKATVACTWAGRRGGETVDVVEGGEVEVRVVVR
jgi:hypothetical protein